MIKSVVKDFLKLEASGGILLFFAAALAMVCVNSGLARYYYAFLSFPIPLNLSFVGIYKDLDVKSWIDDAFMAIFFLLVGLELKREVVMGELSTKAKMMLPACAAIGGVIFPAIIYSHINATNEIGMKGWAIPTATDIAFAIGILNLFGNKIPKSLKVFLVALAVLDDLAAIIIIAVFYTNEISLGYLDLALFMLIFLIMLNKKNVMSLVPYLCIGAILWVFVLKSGVHATIAGVMLSMFIPNKKDKNGVSPSQKLETYLYSSVSYLILPIFAFANAGIVFAGISEDIIFNEVVVGIALGLFFGKQIGVTYVVFLLTSLKISPFFKNTTWLEFYGVSLLTGVGFTMSLFIGNLAFGLGDNLENEVRVGVIVGSLLSGIFGYLIIYLSIHIKLRKRQEVRQIAFHEDDNDKKH